MLQNNKLHKQAATIPPQNSKGCSFSSLCCHANISVHQLRFLFKLHWEKVGSMEII